MFLLKLIPKRFFSLQARMPRGSFGRYIMTKVFENGNAELNIFVMARLKIKDDDKILEIGFGPGLLVHKMAAVIKTGKIEGVDFSEEMLKQAGNRNKKFIEKGLVGLQKCDCRHLPFKDNSFDKICTVNTIYFWKSPEDYLAEMYRVLKSGGKTAIGFRDDKQMSNLNISKDIFTTYSKADVVHLLSKAGFSNAQVFENRAKPIDSFCAEGLKF